MLIAEETHEHPFVRDLITTLYATRSFLSAAFEGIWRPSRGSDGARFGKIFAPSEGPPGAGLADAPGPVSVSSLTVARPSKPTISCTSRSHPNRGVRCAGRANERAAATSRGPDYRHFARVPSRQGRRASLRRASESLCARPCESPCPLSTSYPSHCRGMAPATERPGLDNVTIM